MLGVFVLVIVVLLWALVAGRMATLSITTAIAIVVVGMILTAGSNPVIRIDLDTKIVERGVELTLAMLLFLDATEVRGGVMRRERRVLLRPLAIALPLSLLIAWLVGLALFPPARRGCSLCWRSSSCPSIWRPRWRSSATHASPRVCARS